jgi:DNA-binding Lrp family transcriptional regulator
MKELRPIDYRILFELIKNSRLSDRKLAEILHVSQPTVTRRRAIIEKKRLVEYTATPDLGRLGFEILAFTFARLKSDYSEKVQETKAFLTNHPNMLFASTGTGMNWDRICVSAHKSYSDYTTFIRELRTCWDEYIERPVSFIVSLQSDSILRNLSFKYLADMLEKELGRSGE